MKPYYAPIKDNRGNIIGIWVADPEQSDLVKKVEVFAAGEGIPVEAFARLSEERYRRVPNTANDLGGAFLMLGDALAPGEENSQASFSTKK